MSIYDIKYFLALPTGKFQVYVGHGQLTSTKGNIQMTPSEKKNLLLHTVLRTLTERRASVFPSSETASQINSAD